ncbi:hypothetical protein FSP39_005701 [Pinctada imbricata]|uniref:Fibronectin type-III domain-containing protein n=1 Tax=Pinctada imbricata TaxID=66713 RepID=A0AA88Y3C1_PINIB|nr:hypothetical protein FSP39_005701 [Pinctada imbricata]
MKKDTRKPSTPNVKFIQPDEVTIIWGPPSDLTGLAQYQVRFRSGNGKWKFHNTENTISECSIKRLRANTEYEFQVRGIFGDEEGPYSEVGVKVKTKESLGHKLVSFSALLKDSYPKIYQLFTTEDVQARNDEQKTRKVYLENQKPKVYKIRIKQEPKQTKTKPPPYEKKRTPDMRVRPGAQEE